MFHEQARRFLLFPFWLFEYPALILLIPGRSKKEAPAVLEDAPAIRTKENILRAQAPCALFFDKSPCFTAAAFDGNAYPAWRDAPPSEDDAYAAWRDAPFSEDDAYAAWRDAPFSEDDADAAWRDAQTPPPTQPVMTLTLPSGFDYSLCKTTMKLLAVG